MYAVLFLLAVIVCFVAVPACDRWERRQDAKDAELWATMPGATR